MDVNKHGNGRNYLHVLLDLSVGELVQERNKKDKINQSLN